MFDFCIEEISTHGDGGPRSRVCACETLRSAPHRQNPNIFVSYANFQNPMISPSGRKVTIKEREETPLIVDTLLSQHSDTRSRSMKLDASLGPSSTLEELGVQKNSWGSET